MGKSWVQLARNWPIMKKSFNMTNLRWPTKVPCKMTYFCGQPIEYDRPLTTLRLTLMKLTFCVAFNKTLIACRYPSILSKWHCLKSISSLFRRILRFSSLVVMNLNLSRSTQSPVGHHKLVRLKVASWSYWIGHMI